MPGSVPEKEPEEELLSFVTNNPIRINDVRIPTIMMITKNFNNGTISTMILTYDPNTERVTYNDNNTGFLALGPQLTEQLFQEKREIIYDKLSLLRTPQGEQWDIGHVYYFDKKVLKDVLTANCDSDYENMSDED